MYRLIVQPKRSGEQQDTFEVMVFMYGTAHRSTVRLLALLLGWRTSQLTSKLRQTSRIVCCA